ncbi:MAG: SDR family NAD(P)-dependent oxidoreductase [Planctomycetota bacterium]
MSDLGFPQQTVIVSGGGRGIGAAVAAAFADRGATVYALDLAGSGNPRVRFLEVDVRESKCVDAAVARAADETGRLDAVVAGAGVTRDRMLWKLSDEDWRAVLAVNLDGAFYLLRAAVPHLRQRAQGAIVLIGSINGERGKLGQANYTASKAGVIALGKTAARELGRFGIRVNVVAPGFIDTEMTRSLEPRLRAAAVAESALGRTGQPADVADVIVFSGARTSRAT